MQPLASALFVLDKSDHLLKNRRVILGTATPGGDVMSAGALKIEPAPSLAEEVARRSGQNLLACYQCRRCAAGCPVGAESGVTPDRLIRLILLGDAAGALDNLLVWKCLACYTCGTRCPNDIQTARITEVLKQISKKQHREPLVPKVAAFHGAFVKAAGQAGRFNELAGMALYEKEAVLGELKRGGLKAAIAELSASAKLGRAMMKKKRMHLKYESVKNKGEIKALYRKAGR
jgi:heterodisulfide reductase subunit C